MRIKMLENFQSTIETAVHAIDGLRVSGLEKGEEYEVDTRLGEELIAHRKAEKIKSNINPPAQSRKSKKEAGDVEKTTD